LILYNFSEAENSKVITYKYATTQYKCKNLVEKGTHTRVLGSTVLLVGHRMPCPRILGHRHLCSE
jgi:hypothetical protein